IRAALADPEGGFWVGTGNGLYHQTPAGVSLYQKPEDILSCDVQGIAYAPDGSLWAGGFGGITVFKNGEKSATIGTAEGLPSPYVQSIAQGPDGRMWVGTLLGVTRYDGTKWSLRHSRRWLLGDDVRGVAFGADGTAWVATAGGVSTIKRKTVTLAEKARYFHEVCMARHVRAPWIVEKCRLDTPGDLSTYKPEDDDNDGGYTAFYMVMEAMRYAVTKDAGAKENARKAFDLLELLQTITETDGFFARTIVPSTWTKMHDPGDDFDARELADSRVGDPRQKPVKERWHLSRDGQWFWKGDTSSDEVTAHMYGYLFYYDLVADDAEKARVRALVCRIMDHIVSNGFVLVDIDGKHTRWGVWAPERLNGDPDWAAEQGINSLEILSYLKTAYHVSGDAKYQEQYERLIEEHGYGEMARHAKTFAPAWRTHIDDELLCFAFPALLLYEKDSELKALYRESLDRWYEGVRNDCNPYFNFMYAALTGSDPNMDDSIAFLRDAPLDLVNWTVDNSTREDLKLERAPEVEPLQTHPLPPADERGVMRWDKNPWMAVSGDGGTSEWCPAYWLTPYWMGRYYGYIGAAE
ncbi:MAG: hypothetical protein QG656_2307, partial [Candidatus Hydrogenedentes bacterium]|nr:hypothetical protein [Candidatus Hydrogenedentota bacterium]